MKISKLLSMLLFGLNFKFGVVAEDGGGEVVIEEEQEPEEQEEQNEEAQEQEEATEENNEDELVIQIGDEEPEEDETATAPQWVKELRKNHRELQRELRETKQKLAEKENGVSQPKQLGAKPTLEGCDYDAEKFEAELETWHNKKREIEAEERRIQEQQENANRAWQEKLNGYATQKTALKVKDYQDAEDLIKETLSVTQQGIIVKGAANAAHIVYALGKNPKKAKELAAISDPVEFAFAVARLETQLKVTNRKTPPPPEKTVTGNARVSGTVDNQLERLRAEAAKSGDYTKVNEYKRQLKAKQK